MGDNKKKSSAKNLRKDKKKQAEQQLRAETKVVVARRSGPPVLQEFELDTPAFFTCTSGQLLWGQLGTVLEGSTSEKIMTVAGPHVTNDPTRNGGTIVQRSFHYRVAARKGQWKVEPAFMGGFCFGYVCYHIDADGVDILRRASKVHSSNSDTLEDKEIVFINRCDWGRWAGRNPKEIYKKKAGLPRRQKVRRQVLSDDSDDWEEENEEEHYMEHLVMGRFMLLDAEGFPTLVQALQDGEILELKNYMLRNTIEDRATSSTEPSTEPTSFGVNVVTKASGDEGSGDELGWMAFQNGELIGFVWDGINCDLEEQHPSALTLGGTVVNLPYFQDIDETAPAIFSCTSGHLLWGQMHTVIEGSTSEVLDAAAGPQECLCPIAHGGTILQETFRYRVAARKGQWKVEPIFLGKSWHVGYVCHHIDVGGMDILCRASETGLASDQSRKGKEIIFVNRYDWGLSRSSYKKVFETLFPMEPLQLPEKDGDCCQHDYSDNEDTPDLCKPKDDEDEEEDENDEIAQINKSLSHNRLILLDAESFPILVEALRSHEELGSGNYLLRDSIGERLDKGTSTLRSSESYSFGVNLTIKDTEYELGWMAFQDDELVGFVYDGAYCALEEVDGQKLRLGETVVNM